LTGAAATVSAPLRKVSKYLAQIALVFAAYFVVGKLGQALPSLNSGHIGAVLPASGIALAALLFFGDQVWPGVAAGAFFVALSIPTSSGVAVVQGIGATAAALTGSILLRRIVHFNPSMSRLRDVLGLITFGAFSSSLVSATIGTLLLYFVQFRGWAGLGRVWIIYWLGDSIGVLLLTPLV